MAYNKDTNWENEKKYLDNLSKTGTAGEKAWAENQKKVLASAQSQYSGSSSGSTTTSSGGSKSNTTTTTSSKSSGSSGGNSQYTYTIGSDLGKQTAQNMAIGGTYTASDGSVWKKENDGSITVTHGGTTYQNAYTPTDYSITLQQQMQAGVPYEYVQSTLDNRINKINGDSSLSDYMYDDIHNAALQYIAEGKGTEKKDSYLEDVENSYDTPQPTAPQRDPRIDKILNEILTRGDFSYDALNDPLYQQYANIYQREGDRAMRNTLAEAAASAGGMNTYAITAAQQANNYYNSQLGDKIPELYQLAYEMYLADKESKVQDLGLLQDMDTTQYNRYRDTMNDWKDDRQFAYGVYKDAVNQGNLQTDFDYNASIGNRDFLYNDYWNKLKWNTSQTETERESAKEEVLAIIEAGKIPPSDLVAKSGLNQATVDAMVANKKKSDSGSGGNGGSGGGNGYTGKGNGGSGDGDYTDIGNPEGTDTSPSKDNIEEIEKTCEGFSTNSQLEDYLDSLAAEGTISVETADVLYSKYKTENDIPAYDADGNITGSSYSDMVKSSKGWKVESGGGVNLWGIDGNAIVMAPNGEKISLKNLKAKLKGEGMSDSEASKAIKALQQNLEISSNWMFGW